MNPLLLMPIVFGGVALVVGGVVVRATFRARRTRRAQETIDALVNLFRAGQADEAQAQLRALGAGPGQRAILARRLAEEECPGPARTLLEQARAEAPLDEHVLVNGAIAYAVLDDSESLQTLLATAAEQELSSDFSLELARVAANTGHLELAAGFYADRLQVRGRELDVAAEFAQVLIASGRADEAVPLLVEAMHLLRRQGESGELWTSGGEDYYNDMQTLLFDLHEHAVSLTAPKETAIDGLAATGMLNPKAAVNYTLVGYAALVESTRAPRRVEVPAQAELEATFQATLANDPSSAAGQEDRGLFLLREGRLDEAEARFRELIQLDPDSWPAYVGLGATLEALRYPTSRLLSEAVSPPEVLELAKLVPAWEQLTEFERRYVALCIAPLGWAVAPILAEGGALHLVSLDARTTDVPFFAEAQGVESDDGRSYDAIGGMARGQFAVTRIDELYQVEPTSGWTLAHEFAHVVLNVAEDAVVDRAAELLEQFRELGFVGTTYGLSSLHEFFACSYERYAIRCALPDAHLDEVHDADREYGLEAFFRELSAR